MLEFSSPQDFVVRYINAPLSLGGAGPVLEPVLAVVGMACLVAGVVLAVLARDRRSLWMLPALIFTVLGPVVLGFANSVIGWFGVLFSLVAGAVILLLWTAMVARDSERRIAVWLLGAFLMTMVVFAGVPPTTVILGLD